MITGKFDQRIVKKSNIGGRVEDHPDVAHNAASDHHSPKAHRNRYDENCDSESFFDDFEFQENIASAECVDGLKIGCMYRPDGIYEAEKAEI